MLSEPPAERKVNAVEVWSLIAAAALATFYLVTSLYIASHRLFWFDELFTVHMVRLPHLLTILTALAHAADIQPPLYYVIVRMSDKLFGYSEVAVRLPSALAMVAGLLVTFDCSRRLTDGLHGLIALSVLTCSFLPYFGYEARPYGFYFLLSALALWIWTCTRDDSKWSAFFFGAVLFLGVMMHYYAVLNVVPYVLWEASRWKPWRRPSPKLIAGVAGVALAAALLAPLAIAFSRQFSASSWAHPSFYELRTVFSELFPNSLFLLALIVIWVGLMRLADRTTTVEEMQPAESVGWLFLCIPIAGFVLAELKTNAFLVRYFMGALPGVAVAFSCWLWRHFHNTYRISVGVLLLLATWGAANQLKLVSHPELISPADLLTPTKQYLALEGSLRLEGKRFFLFSRPTLYLMAEYYSKHPDECVSLLPSGFTPQSNTARYPIEHVMLNLSRYYPMQFWQSDDLREHAKETALILPSADALDALTKAGFKLQVRYSQPLKVVYLQ